MKDIILNLISCLEWTEHLNDGYNKFFCLRCCHERPKHSETCPVAKALKLGRDILLT